MNIEEMLRLLDDWVVAKTGKPLTVIERAIIHQSWDNVKYRDMQISNYTPSYVEKTLARNLWNRLSDVIGDGERVSKKNLKILVQRAINTRSRSSPPAPPLSQESKDAIVMNNRAFDSYITGDLIQAKKQFELALKINQDHGASYYNLGWSYEQVGDFDRAIELYRQAASHGFAAAYCNLARLHIIEEKKYDLAVDICRRGLTLVQEDTVETDKIVKAALLTYLAWAWIDQGRDEEALEKLQEALELERDRALTHALMAQALDNLGQPTEALEAWKNYINKYSKCNCRDKDVWMGKARKRLKGKSGTSPPNGNLD